MYVSVSQGRHNKLLKTRRLKTTETYFVTELEAGLLKSRCWQGLLPLKTLERLLPHCSLAYSYVSQISASVWRSLSFFCVCLFSHSLLVRLVFGFRAYRIWYFCLLMNRHPKRHYFQIRPHSVVLGRSKTGGHCSPRYAGSQTLRMGIQWSSPSDNHISSLLPPTLNHGMEKIWWRWYCVASDARLSLRLLTLGWDCLHAASKETHMGRKRQQLAPAC